MKYAVIKTGGKQYKVTEGTILEVEKLDSDGKIYVFDEVLLIVDGDNVQVGAPTVEGIKVYADVIAEVKGEKIEVFKYKSKSRYRKHTGHRQKYTRVKINGIGAPVGARRGSPVKAVVKKKPATKKPVAK